MSVEVIAAIVGAIAAIVGALIGALVAAYYLRQQVRLEKDQAAREREKQSRESAALFLEAIAQAMRGMAMKLEAKEVPYFEGNAFTDLLDSYEDAVREYLGDQVREDIDRLKELAYRTRDIDPALLRLRDLVPDGAALDPEDLQSSLDNLSADLQRSAASASTQATQIKADLL